GAESHVGYRRRGGSAWHLHRSAAAVRLPRVEAHQVMARLSTHVLDTARGVAAQGLLVELYFLGGGERQKIASAITNAHGRTDQPLLDGERIEIGVYELA